MEAVNECLLSVIVTHLLKAHGLKVFKFVSRWSSWGTLDGHKRVASSSSFAPVDFRKTPMDPEPTPIGLGFGSKDPTHVWLGRPGLTCENPIPRHIENRTGRPKDLIFMS